MSHFYLTLPSNSSMQYYANNTATKYTTKLSQMMELDGNWEVGLVEITCPGKLINVRKRQCGVRVQYRRSSSLTPSLQSTYWMNLREGQYRDIYDIVRATNELLVAQGGSDRMVQSAILRYIESVGRVEIRVKGGFRIKFNSELARRLGFSSTATYTGRTMGLTPQPEGIDVRSLYVYCDLLEPVPVGDVKVPLLRIVNMDETSKEYSNMHRIMKRVLFVPVQKKHFDTVEIQILDDAGDVVPFDNGKSIVVLEFRRTVHPYFLTNA